jgi:DNA-binding response OmpR family regulator
MLPQLSGVAVVGRLREAGHSLPVLMLSALGRSVEKIDGLTAGADDYCVKPTPAAEIEARLNALLRARGWTAGEADTLQAGDIVVSPGQHRAWRGEQPLDLTRLEFGLLAELVRHAGSYLTRAMLIERVWGYDFEPGTNIVDAQVRLLRRKLTADGRDDPIATKRGVGYMLRP